MTWRIDRNAVAVEKPAARRPTAQVRSLARTTAQPGLSTSIYGRSRTSSSDPTSACWGARTAITFTGCCRRTEPYANCRRARKGPGASSNTRASRVLLGQGGISFLKQDALSQSRPVWVVPGALPPSRKSREHAREVLCSRKAVFPRDHIIAVVGYDYRNSQRLMRLAHLGADRNCTFLPACCGYRADIY